MTPHWYQLVTENGTPMGSITKVKLDTTADVDDFRDAVKAKNPDLADIPPRNLTVYFNMAAYEKRATIEPLDTALLISGLGTDNRDNALVVVVPNKSQGIEI